MIRFNANLFRIAAMAQSNEETRYYLKGVFVEPHAIKGVTLTATDGHRLLSVHDENGFADETAIVNLGDVLKQCKPKRGERRDVVIYTGSKDAILNLTFATKEKNGTETLEDKPIATAYGCKIEGSFPDYRRVVPMSFEPEQNHFNGVYLGDFGKIGAELLANAGLSAKPSKYSSEPQHGAMLVTGAAGSPCLVRWSGVDNAFGILMPMRGKAESNVPPWFRAVAPSPAIVPEVAQELEAAE